MKKLKPKKNGDAHKKRSGREVRGVSPETERESMVKKICVCTCYLVKLVKFSFLLFSSFLLFVYWPYH